MNWPASWRSRIRPWFVCLSAWSNKLIERRPCPHDRRARRLHLTTAGRAFMDDLSERAEVLREEMLEGISDKEIECTVKVFHKILENAEKQK